MRMKSFTAIKISSYLKTNKIYFFHIFRETCLFHYKNKIMKGATSAENLVFLPVVGLSTFEKLCYGSCNNL